MTRFHSNVFNVILSCVLLSFMGVLPSNALDGTGTQTDPYKITSNQDWTDYAAILTGGGTTSNPAACAKLTTDITVSSPVATTSSAPFSGTLDGDGHKITLSLNGGQFTSLIKYAKAATVKNLWIDGSITATGKCCAALFGDVQGSNSATANITTITNCISSVTITTSLSGDATEGGFVGDTYGTGSSTNGTIHFINCLFNGEISGGKATNCAGLLGYDNGGKSTYTHCFVTARFKVQDNDGKTLARNLKTTADDCYYYPSFGVAYGNDAQGATQLTDIDYRMGGVAYLMQKYSDENKLAEGSAFFFGKAVPTSYSSLHIFDEGDGTGFCTEASQRVYKFTVTTSAYDATTSTLSDKAFTFYGNNGQNVSTLVKSVLGFTSTGLGTLTEDNQSFKGDLGLGIQTATIANVEDWNRFCWRVNENGETALNATMTGDVSDAQLMAGDPGDVSGYNRIYNSNRPTAAHAAIIKLTSQAYRGTFNGQGHTLSLAYTDDYCVNQPFYTAPFRYVKDGATIENLHVTGTITAKGKCASGLIGSGASGGTGTTNVSGCRVSATINCQLASELLGISTGFGTDATLGGYFGDNQGATIVINNSLFDGAFTSTSTSASNFSGFLGYNQGGSSSISNSLCVSDFSSLSGNHAIGRNISKVSNCYSKYTLTNLDNASVPAADSITSGTIAWRLQGTQTDLVWGQNISGLTNADKTKTNDSYPFPLASSSDADDYKTARRVWRIYYNRLTKNSDGTAGGTWKLTQYTNNNQTHTLPTYTELGMAEGHLHFMDMTNKKGLTAPQPITANTSITFDDYRRNPEDMYILVGSSDEWNYLAEQYAAGTAPGFSDIRFDSPFTATEKCGTYAHPFSGNVDGNHQTITLNLTGSEERVGLFGNANNIYLKDLTVNGSITSDYQFAAGIVGYINKTSTLDDCVSAVTINSSLNGDATHGGLVGVSSSTAINNCAFIGTIHAPSAYGCGGIVGWGNNSTTVNNSWCYGKFSLTNDGTSKPNSPIIRSGTITNSYYTQWPYTNDNDSIALKDVKRGEAASKLQGSQTEAHWTQQFGVGPKHYEEADKTTQNYIYYDVTTDSKWHCSDLLMEDDGSKANKHPYYQSFSFLADNVSFTRQFTDINTPTYTLILPFTIPASKKADFGKFYTFDRIEGANAVMTELPDNDDVAANTPYIFNPAVKTLPVSELGGLTLSTDNLTDDGTTGMKGRYDMEVYDQDMPNYYHYAAGNGTTGVAAGTFAWCMKGSWSSPYRAYFFVAPETTSNPAKSYNVVISEGTATGIVDLQGTGTSKDDEPWYTLSGTRLSTVPTKAGIYIHGNKKIAIK